MRIGIISDTHDNIWRLADALPHLQTSDAVLHCGDLISPFMIHRLGKGLGEIPVHAVWGNNDGDKRALTQVAGGYSNIHLHGDFVELDLGGLRIAINHYPEIGRALANSGQYDLVCYGHDHTAHQERIGETWLLNPGEVMGMNGNASLMIFDTGTRQVELMTVWQG